MESFDRSSGLRYHNFDTGPDTEFKLDREVAKGWPCTEGEHTHYLVGTAVTVVERYPVGA